LKRASRFVAALAVLSYLLTGCAGSAQPAASVFSGDTVVTSGASVAAVYRALDDSSADAYVAATLLDPRQSVGASQPCLKTDNSMASRPSPLANPPLAALSIAQRARLVESLVSYELALASFAGGAPRLESSLAASQLQRAVFEFAAAANAHAQGDLFVEDLAAQFNAIAAKLAVASGAGDARRIALDANPTIAKLLAVLAHDVSQKHAEALAASRSAIALWLAYYAAARRAAAPGGAMAVPANVSMPRCQETAFSPDDTSKIVDDSATDGATFPGRDVVLARLRAADERDEALRAADPASVVSALSALNDALLKALASSPPGDDGSVGSALLHLRTSVQSLAAACRPLQGTSF
jgi:hypothetical protein